MFIFFNVNEIIPRSYSSHEAPNVVIYMLIAFQVHFMQ